MIPDNARDACGDDNCHASKELSKIVPNLIGTHNAPVVEQNTHST